MAQKIRYVAIAATAVLIVVLILYFRAIYNDEWALRAAAKQAVTDATYIDRVERFAGEKEYHILFGSDANGRQTISWTDGTASHTEYADAGISEEQVRQRVIARHPDNEPIRIVPGVLDGVYVWEAFYKRKEEDGTRYFYDYYRFDNGAEIDTWRLSKR